MNVTLRFALAAVAFAAAPAAAQPVTTPSEVQPVAAALSISILDPDASIHGEDVRAAISGELGIDVVDAGAFAPSHGRLEIAIDRGEVRIAYHPAAGTTIERVVALPIAEADRVQLITFIATNLVRDQASEVLGGLPAVPPIAPPPPPAVRRTASPTTFVPFTIGFVPPLTIDRVFGQRVAVGFGLHAVMGSTDEVRAATISGAVDFVTGDLHGAQIGGAVAATFGHARGLQLGGAVALARGSLFGAQIGGAATVAGGDSTGIQIGGAVAIADKLYGAQIGGAATAAKRIDGLQIAGAASTNKSIRGAMISGAANVSSGRVDGLQLAGAVNIAGEVNGLQLGVVNIAKKMRGVQLGIINLSDDGDDSLPIGLINYSKNGGITLDGWVDSSRVASVGFRHGTKRVHNIWALGASPDHDNVMLGAGLGFSHRMADTLGVDIDVMHWLTDIWDLEYGQINQLRASLAVPVGGGLEAFGGVAYNVYITDVMNDNTDNFHPVMARTYQPTDDTKIVTWPSAFVGVRIKAR